MKKTNIACSCTATLSVEVAWLYCAFPAACTRGEQSGSVNPFRTLSCAELSLREEVVRSDGALAHEGGSLADCGPPYRIEEPGSNAGSATDLK